MAPATPVPISNQQERPRTSGAQLLELDGVVRTFGGLRAVDGVSLKIKEGEIHGIIGANGAGKTTLFKTISGTVAPVSGAITSNGRDLLAVPPAGRAQLGIAHVPGAVRYSPP